MQGIVLFLKHENMFDVSSKLETIIRYKKFALQAKIRL